MRIVLDTASLVAAIRSADGASREVLRMIFREELVPLLDLKLALEYHEVTLRREHVSTSKLTRREIVELVDALEAFAEPVTVTKTYWPMSTDPDDDMVPDLAINGDADAIITSNKKHFTKSARQFRIAVLTPSEFLHMVRKD